MLKVQEFTKLTGIQYVMADIACKHDKAFEKKQWHERLNHFAEIDFSDPKTFKKASNPIGLRAAVLALKDFEAGNESGYMISLDASSSGMQLLSIMVSCPISWKLCGGDENILDAYSYIYTSMGVSKTLDRKDVKKSIMTALT